MSGPGAELDATLANCPIDELASLLPKDVLSLLSAQGSGHNLNRDIRTVVAAFIRNDPTLLFENPNVLPLLMSGLSSEKRGELLNRVNLNGGSIEDPAAYDENPKERLAGFFGLPWLEEVVSTTTPANEFVEPEFGLFHHQRFAANRVWNRIGRGSGRTILHMPTGAGKTRTSMHLVCRYLQSNEPGLVIWLASSSELLDQAADAFSAAWRSLGNRNIQVFRAWGSHACDFGMVEDGLLVAGFQKLSAALDRDEDRHKLRRLARQVGLVVVDEAHQSIAPTYRELIEMFTGAGDNDALLGLTATPGRSWSDIEADAELSEFFDNHKVTLEVEGYDNPVEYLMENGYLARPEFRQLTYELTETDNTDTGPINLLLGDYPSDVLEELSSNASRNNTILQETLRLIEEGHNRIILFASSVSHARTISAVLQVHGVRTEMVTGDTPKVLRNKAIGRFRRDDTVPCVMCNFGVLTTGFDAPRTSAAIIARPTKSLVLFSQMVGRATRGTRAGGNESCVISTVVDVQLPGFRDMSEAFTNWEDVYHDR